MVRSGHFLLLALVGAVTVGAAALRAQDKPLSQKGFSAAPPDGRASGSQDPGVGSDAGWSVTEDSKEGYRMSLPGDWSLRDLDGESVAPLVERMRRADSGMTEVEAEWVGTEIAQSIRLLATESSPKAVARGFGAIFLLLRVPVGGALSPVGLAEMVRKQGLPAGASVEGPEERLLPAGPAAALRMSFSTVLSDGKYEVIRERRMYVLRGDYAYLLDLLSPEEGDEAYAAAFERICGSLEFTTPPPPLVQEAPLLRRCPGAVLDLDLVRVPAGPTGLTLKLPWPPAPSLVMPPDSLPSTVEAAADCVGLSGNFFVLTVVSIQTPEGALTEAALLQDLLEGRARRMKKESVPGREVHRTAGEDRGELRSIRAGREHDHAVRCIVLVRENHAWIVTAEYWTDDEVAAKLMDRILKSAKIGGMPRRRRSSTDPRTLMPRPDRPSMFSPYTRH